MNTSTRLYTLGYTEPKTYVAATLFIAGNIILPQLFHLIPQGGVTWLPIYFFTLIAAYKYGWKVGLLTALCSPAVNSLLFGMPAAAALPAIYLKSALLALGAGYAAHRFNRVSLPALAAVVAFSEPYYTIQKVILVPADSTLTAEQAIKGKTKLGVQRGTTGATFTVRKVSDGVGVERIFPLHSPFIDHVEVVTQGRVRRSRLYYLRALKGKAARIKPRGRF